MFMSFHSRCAAQYREITYERARTEEFRERVAIMTEVAQNISPIRAAANFFQANGICGGNSRALTFNQ